MEPDEIRTLLDDNWIGTREELEAALEQFYNDIRSSFDLAMNQEGVHIDAARITLTTVDDHFYNHYFS